MQVPINLLVLQPPFLFLFFSSFFTVAKEAGFKDEEEASHHILLFVSALIPKALASMLTSFCIATSGLDQVRLQYTFFIRKSL